MPATKKPRRRPAPLAMIYSTKGSAQYKRWLDGLAAHARRPLAIVLDEALTAHARAIGYEPAPPPRT